MPFLEVHRVADHSLRTAPDMWFATMMLKLSRRARDRLRLDFEEFEDDLDSVEFAYMDAGGIPASFQRYANEPADVYTLQVDVSRIQEQHKLSALEFSEALLLSLDIPPEDVVWVNREASECLPILADYSTGERLVDSSGIAGRGAEETVAQTGVLRRSRKL
jgi:hypothetical protein